MTDTLATLRAGCQRGEMPSWYRFLDVVTIANIQSKTAPLDIYEPEKERHLDALHTLQQARRPGSRLDIVSDPDTRSWLYLAGIWLPAGGFSESVVSQGEDCPTILAGLQGEKDDE